MECAICLNSVRKTRATKELPCGHLYHAECIDNWDKETCPLCRSYVGENDYRVSITIENLRERTSNTTTLSIEQIQTMIERLGLNHEDLSSFSTEVMFEAENLESLEAVLSDFGISRTDFDSLVFHTE